MDIFTVQGQPELIRWVLQISPHTLGYNCFSITLTSLSHGLHNKMDPVLLWELFSNSVQYLEENAINYMWIMSSGHYWENVVTIGKKARPRTLSQTHIYPILLQHNTKNYINWKEVGKLYTSLEVKSTDLAYDRQTNSPT